MTATRVKICGIRTEAELELAVSAGADAVGLLCSVPVESPREISEERATALAERTPPFVTAVLVTMGDSFEAIAPLADVVDPDAIQVHGDISPAAVERLSRDRPVIRAVDVGDGDAVRASADRADAVLLDSTDERGAGGTGRTNDWTAARSIVHALEVPVMLAGGLTPENVTEAIDRVGPYAVDVASGVEGDDGKDPTAVRSFVAAARRPPNGDAQ